MLKRKLTEDQWNDLIDDRQRELYKKTSDGDYLLHADEDTKSLRSLTAERRNHAQTTRHLVELVPALVDTGTASGYVDRKGWRALVEAQSELLGELGGEDFDLDAWRRFQDDPEGGGGDAPDEVQIAKDLREALADASKLRRENGRLVRQVETSVGQVTELEAENNGMVMTRDLGVMFDEIGVTAPIKRRTAKALFLQDMKMSVVDGQTVVEVDGSQVPILEFASEWGSSEDGKEFVAATENSGGGDGGSDPPRKKATGDTGTGDARELTSEEKMALGFKESEEASAATI
jgi:hypothetical protein